MNRGLWIARKNYLFALMKKVSDAHGGDDIQFLREQWQEIVDSHPGEKIEEPIASYLLIVDQLRHRRWQW